VVKARFGTPEEVGAAFERELKRLRKPPRQKRYDSAQDVLDEVRKVLGTPEGECVVEWAKQMALKHHG